jgi:3-hydroxyisobutyrate dehydrogenase-like beta-hydroxyacid dehydrogenase
MAWYRAVGSFVSSHDRFQTYVRVVQRNFTPPVSAKHLIKEDAQIASLNTTTTPKSTELTAAARQSMKNLLFLLGSNQQPEATPYC